MSNEKQLQEAFDLWLSERPDMKDTGKEFYFRLFRKYILPWENSFDGDFLEYVESLDISLMQKNKVRRLFSSISKKGGDLEAGSEEIPFNTRVTYEPKYMSDTSIKAFLGSVEDPRLKRAFFTVLNSGCSLNEVLALHKSDLRPITGTISVSRRLLSNRELKQYDRKKTRVIPIKKDLFSVLQGKDYLFQKERGVFYSYKDVTSELNREPFRLTRQNLQDQFSFRLLLGDTSSRAISFITGRPEKEIWALAAYLRTRGE